MTEHARTQEPVLDLLKVKVPEEWIDFNGHMTEFRYTQCFSDSCEVLLQLIGAHLDYLKSGYSYYTVENHVRLLSEATLGDELLISAQVLPPSDGKKVRCFMWMHRVSDGKLVATYEHLMLHVSSALGRTVPALESVTCKLQPLIDLHAALPLPEGAGRYVGQRASVASADVPRPSGSQ